MNWRSPDSEVAKMQLMRHALGDHIPDYCYYLLPAGVTVDEGYTDTTFFPNSRPRYGDKEMHSSRGLNLSGLCSLGDVKGVEPFIVLRIRDCKVTPPPAITMNGAYCPLVQFGHSKNHARKGLDGKTPAVINFIEEWGWAAA